MRGQAVMFSSEKDEWATPQALFDELNAEFGFLLDAAATVENRKCVNYRGLDHGLMECRNGLVFDWAESTWCNPPYSKCRAFIAKAAEEAKKGNTVVCLVYARTDTRWFHAHVYDATTNSFRPGVEVRFIKGRVKFGGAKAGAPAPSMVVIFRPVE